MTVMTHVSTSVPMTELDELRELAATLRAERDDALARAAAAERECQILQLSQRGIAAARVAPPAPGAAIRTTPSERVQRLEHAVDVLESFALRFADWDCDNDYENPLNDKAERCDCAPCRAERALAEIRDWRMIPSRGATEIATRFIGAMHERTQNGFNPHESNLHAAWASRMDDRKLGMILTDRPRSGGIFDSYDWPSARDWYVATSVVQWLGTHIGTLDVLERAGYRLDPELEKKFNSQVREKVNARYMGNAVEVRK